MWVTGACRPWRQIPVLCISCRVSARPPTRSPHERESDELEHLEELGDDAIISQQTGLHLPKPRANVSEESRSVVITDHPPERRDTEPRRVAPRRSSAEATLVIRDRRALEEMRAQFHRDRAKKADSRRGLYVWAALGVVAFLLGGIVAFVATSTEPLPEPAPSAPAPVR